MRVVVDGIVYHMQSSGGISRVFNELLPRMCQKDESLEITLLTSKLARQPYPAHPNIRTLKVPWPRWWNSHTCSRVENLLAQFAGVLWRLSVGDTTGLIWHSTYYTESGSWAGPKVVTVYDMVQERFPDLFNTDGSELFQQYKLACIY